jgi:xanthine dehydrogenase/oxidase
VRPLLIVPPSGELAKVSNTAFRSSGFVRAVNLTGQAIGEANNSKLEHLWHELRRDCDLEARRAAVDRFNSANRWRERGISMIPLKYGIAYSDSRGTLGQAGAYVVAYSSDGSVLVSHGGVEMGQGMQTKMTQIAAQTLGIGIGLVKTADADTNVVGDARPD